MSRTNGANREGRNLKPSQGKASRCGVIARVERAASGESRCFHCAAERGADSAARCPTRTHGSGAKIRPIGEGLYGNLPRLTRKLTIYEPSHLAQKFHQNHGPGAAAGHGRLCRHPTGVASRRRTGGDFVTIRNGRFELRGRPYFYVGTNFWSGCYLSDAALPGGRERLVRELDRLQSIGVNNIRLLAGSETSPLAGAIPRGITRAPHDYDEALLAGLDFCLAEMAKRDMRGILFPVQLLAMVRQFRAIRPLDHRRNHSRSRTSPVMANGDWHAVHAIFRALLHDAGRRMNFIAVMSRNSSSAATR